MSATQLGIDVYAEKFLAHYGVRPQQLKAIEELSECAARLAKDVIEDHIAKDSSTYDKTVDKIADATIMLRQMRLAYGFEAVDAAVERKLRRTWDRIEG